MSLISYGLKKIFCNELLLILVQVLASSLFVFDISIPFQVSVK